MAFYAANIKEDKNLSIEAVEQISETEFNDLMKAFEYMHEIKPMNVAYDIMQRNAREFLFEISVARLQERHLKNKEKVADIAIDANRLISNFCASMQTFVDYVRKTMKHQGEKSFDYIEKYISSVFDKEFAYRFFYKLRNYCVHYSFPYSSIQVSAPDTVSLICQKDHLMEYNGWGAVVTKDFADLPDVIDLRTYIEHLLVFLASIQLNVYLYYGESIFNANKAIALFAENHHLSSPTILEIDKDNETSIRPIPVDSVIFDMKMLEQHPNARVAYVQQASEMRYNKTEKLLRDHI